MSELVVHQDGMLSKEIIFCQRKTWVACDGNCQLAFGMNWHGPKIPPAPEDPGTYEGGHAKPTVPEERLNKWCVRECERCQLAPIQLSVPATM